jgi:hypothetical protein
VADYQVPPTQLPLPEVVQVRAMVLPFLVIVNLLPDLE